jgi:Ca2+:H+ antiporter
LPKTDFVLFCPDGVINVALYHCLAPSIQTALLTGPLVVLVGWAIGKPMDLNFEIFMICLLVLSILVVGNFLRDGESNWLEGALLVVRHSSLYSVHLRSMFVLVAAG